MLSASKLLWLLGIVLNVAAEASTPRACAKTGSFANCKKYNLTAHGCATMSGSPFTSCLCNQGYFDAIVGCMNDDLHCNQNKNHYYHTATSLIADFHSTCAPHVTVTTPPMYSISRTIYPGACEMVHSDCMDEINFLRSCSSEFFGSKGISFDDWGPSPTAASIDPKYCTCQQRGIQLASRCTYNANISCMGRDAEMTKMGVYKTCDLADVTPWFSSQEPTGLVATERMVVTSYKTVRPTGTVPTTSVTTGQGSSPATGRKDLGVRCAVGVMLVAVNLGMWLLG